MKKRFIIFLLLESLFSSILSARGGSDENVGNNQIEITGIIKIKGSEPHTTVTLITEEGIHYILIGEKSFEIRANYQLKTLKIKAEILETAQALMAAEVEVLSYKVLKS